MANRLLNQARLTSRVKYEPQRQQLSQAQREAQEAFNQTVLGGRSSAIQGLETIHAATPAVVDIYNRAEGQSQDIHNTVATALKALGPGAQGYQASAAVESAGASDKLGRERARTLGGLHTQEVAAATAPQAAQVQASQQLSAALAKIFASGQSLASQEGSNTAAEYGNLTDAQRKEAQKAKEAAEGRRVTERGQNLTRKSAKEAHRGAPGGGVKPATTAENHAAAKEINEILYYAKHAPSNLSRQDRAGILTEGSPGESVSSSEKNTAGGTNSKSHTVGKIPAFSPGPLQEAALDIAEYGFVRKATAQQLAKNGYNLAVLGLPREPDLRHRKAIKKVSSAAGSIGKGIPGSLGGF